MLTINIPRAQTHLSCFVEQAAAGEIIIAKAGKPNGQLKPLQSLLQHRNLSMFKGWLSMSGDFDDRYPAK